MEEKHLTILGLILFDEPNLHTGEYATAQEYAYPWAVFPQIFIYPVLNDFPDYCFLDNRRKDNGIKKHAYRKNSGIII